MSQVSDKYGNPPFDDRIYSLSGLKATSASTGVSTGDLQRGYMIQDDVGVNPGGIRYSVRFLYNPSVISVSHNTDAQSDSAIMPQQYRNPADQGNWNIPVQASVSFALLFDRTYELWDPQSGTGNTYDETSSPSKVGVAVDVAAVYRVVGILQPTVGNDISVNTKGLSPQAAKNAIEDARRNPVQNVVLDQGSIGPMPMTPCRVYFGGSSSLSYHGYINQLSIQYTHFSQLMVPMRCTINVSMQLIPGYNWTANNQ